MRTWYLCFDDCFNLSVSLRSPAPLLGEPHSGGKTEGGLPQGINTEYWPLTTGH